jgi:taurine dioxygenase
MRYDWPMAIETRPLSEGFGVEVLDVDLSQPLGDATFAQIEAAFYRGQVLAVRAQSLTPAAFGAWARRFGAPEPHVIDQFHHPADANILVLSNRVEDGRPQGLADAGTYFHTDYSYLPVPARATTLYSIEVPREGGNTLFANQYAAYDDLPRRMKARIEPLVAIHHYGNRNNLDVTTRTVASVLTSDQEASLPLVTHRIARPHPVTGRKALYAVNGTSFGIVGMPDDEARDLLDELAAHATHPRYQLSYAYGVGDVVIWDNASLLHSATLVDPGQPRTLWRITVTEPMPTGGVLARSFAASGAM